MNEEKENNLVDVKSVLGHIFKDNTMAQDALRIKDYRALKVFLERQEKEIDKLFGLLGL